MQCTSCGSAGAIYFSKDGEPLCRACFGQEQVRAQTIRATEALHGLDATGEGRGLRSRFLVQGILYIVASPVASGVYLFTLAFLPAAILVLHVLLAAVVFAMVYSQVRSRLLAGFVAIATFVLLQVPIAQMVQIFVPAAAMFAAGVMAIAQGLRTSADPGLAKGQAPAVADRGKPGGMVIAAAGLLGVILLGLAIYGWQRGSAEEALAEEPEPAWQPPPPPRLPPPPPPPEPIVAPTPVLPPGYRLISGDIWSLALPKHYQDVDRQQFADEMNRHLDAAQRAATPRVLAVARNGTVGPFINLLDERFYGTAVELRESQLQGLTPDIEVVGQRAVRVAARDGWIIETKRTENGQPIHAIQLFVPRDGRAYTLSCVMRAAAAAEQRKGCETVFDTFWLAGGPP